MLLIVGASEVARFDQIRDYIREELGEEITIDSYPGRPLRSCVRIIQEQMTPETKIVLLWALTPLAWRRVNIAEAGRQLTVFGPNEDFSLNEIPQIMEDITTHVRSINRHCAIFLVLPAIKDMYRFNQKRLVQSLGESYRHFLQDDLDLNPHRMRDFAVRAYTRFIELETDDYYWTDKQILKANYAINRHFHLSGRDRRGRRERGWTPPHVRFMQSQSLALNLNIMPDGLHGNADFMRNFILAFRRVFLESLRKNNGNYGSQPAHIEQVQAAPSFERNEPSVSNSQGQESNSDQFPELPSNNIMIPPVPWVSPSTDEPSRERENERMAPSVNRPITPLPVSISMLLGTIPPHPISQQPTVNEYIQGLSHSLPEEITNLSPIVQRTIEEGIDTLLSSIVPRNHTRQDQINALRGIMAISQYKIHQLGN